jgi:phosphoglycerate dehydrogenase-like enzyme
MKGLQAVAVRAGRVAGRRAAAPAPFHSSARSLARVLATDNVDDSCIKIFEERGHKVDLLETMSEADLCKVIGEYDGLVVRSATKVTPEVIKHAKKMRVIGRAGVGYDNINVKEATQYVFALARIRLHC